MPKKKDASGPATISGDVEKSVPEGCEVVNVEATIGSGDDKVKGATISFVVPVLGNAEGLQNFVSFLTDNGVNGVEFATGAIRSAMRSGVSREADPKNPEGAVKILPGPTDIRTIDPAEVAGNKLTNWLRENPGQAPSQKLLKEWGLA